MAEEERLSERQWLVQTAGMLHRLATAPGRDKLAITKLRLIRTIGAGLVEFANRKIEIRTAVNQARRNGFDAFEIELDENGDAR